MAGKKSMKWIVMTVATFFVLGMVGTGLAGTYYVSSDGDDTSTTGNKTDPYYSLLQAFRAVNGTSGSHTVYVNATGNNWVLKGNVSTNAGFDFNYSNMTTALGGTSDVTVIGVNATGGADWKEASSYTYGPKFKAEAVTDNATSPTPDPSKNTKIYMPSDVNLTFKGLAFNSTQFVFANNTTGKMKFTGVSIANATIGENNDKSGVGLTGITFEDSKIEDLVGIGYNATGKSVTNATISNITFDSCNMTNDFGIYAGDWSKLSTILVKDSIFNNEVGILHNATKTASIDGVTIENSSFYSTSKGIQVETETASGTNGTLKNLAFTDNTLEVDFKSKPFLQVLGNATGGKENLSLANFDDDLNSNLKFTGNNLKKANISVKSDVILYAGKSGVKYSSLPSEENATTTFGAEKTEANTIDAFDTTFNANLAEEYEDFGYFSYEAPEGTGQVSAADVKDNLNDKDAGFNATEIENAGITIATSAIYGNKTKDLVSNSSSVIADVMKSLNATDLNATKAKGFDPDKVQAYMGRHTAQTGGNDKALMQISFNLGVDVEKPKLHKLTDTHVYEFTYVDTTNATKLASNATNSTAAFFIQKADTNEVVAKDSFEEKLSSGAYLLSVIIKDNSDFDQDAAAGTILDPAALGAEGAADDNGGDGGGGSSGCAFNPNAGFGMEWLLLLAVPFLMAFRRKFD